MVKVKINIYAVTAKKMQYSSIQMDKNRGGFYGELTKSTNSYVKGVFPFLKSIKSN